MLAIFELIKKTLGLASFSAPVVLLLGVIFAAGGAATWLREDAINDTNAKWELKLSTEALKSHNLVAEKQLELERLQKKLALKEKEDDEKIRADAEVLAAQAAEFPLSPDCVRCRVPNERLWVRGGKTTLGGSGPSSKPNAPGS